MSLDDAIAEIWQRSIPSMRARLEAVEAAGEALADGPLGDEARELAVRAAHQMAGSLGTFGMPEGSELSAALEAELSAAAPSAAVVADLAGRLRTVLGPRL